MKPKGLGVPRLALINRLTRQAVKQTVHSIPDRSLSGEVILWKWTGTEFLCGNSNGYNQPVAITGRNNNRSCISMMTLLNEPDLRPAVLEMFRLRNLYKTP